MTREVKEWWEYTSESFQETAEIPVGINWGWDGLDDEDMLGDVAGEEILELGCGGGQCTVALAELGADVTGLDLSDIQIDHAWTLATERDVEIDLVQGDVTELPFTADSFDLAFNTFVFQWVADLGTCFAETSRVLRSGSRFVFSMPHPFFDLADPETHEIVESYFDTGRQVRVDERVGHPNLVTYRHRISDIHTALRQAGFVIERVLEPGSPEPSDHEAGPWGESPPELRAKLPRVLVVEATT